MRYVLVLSFLVYSFIARAAGEAPQSFNVDGILYGDNTYTTPLLDASVVFNVQVLDPSKTCVLYEENHTVNTAVTGGRYNLSLGTGTRTGDDPGFTLVNVFQNTNAVNPTNAGCGGGTYTPSAGHVRYLRVEITPSSTGTPDTITPDITIGSVPNALVAENIQDIPYTSLLTLTNGSDASALHHHDGRYALLSGSGSITMAAGETIELGEVAGTPGGLGAGDAGKMWIDTSDSNKVKYWDGTSVVDLTAGGGGAVADVFGRTGNVVAATSDYDANQVDNTPNGDIAATDVQAAIDELDSEKLALAGGTMTGNIAMGTSKITGLGDGAAAQDAATMNNISSAITTNNASYVAKAGDSMTGPLTLATQNELRLADDAGGEYISFKSPTGLAGNFDYTLPANYGTSGQVLSTNGSGTLSWAAAGGGADNLGNHTATSNIQLGANFISNDGGASEGLSFDASGNAAFAQSLTSAADVTISAQSDLRLADADSSNYAAIQAPATIGTNYTLTLPANDGAASQVLTTDGSGVLSWTTPPGTTYSADGDGLELTSTTFGLELDGTTLSKGASGLSVNVGTGANQIVQLNGSSELPAVDGSNLTNVSGTDSDPHPILLPPTVG